MAMTRLTLLLPLGLIVVAILSSAAGSRQTSAAAPLSRPGPPKECTKFAAEGGSDAGRGTWRRPFRTAQRLLLALHAGQVGCLRGGTYTASDEYVLDASQPGVTIMSYPGERALLRGIVVVRPGANNVRLARVTVDGTGDHNTIKVYSTNFTLENSDVTNSWRGWSCLILGGSSSGTALRPVIRRNRFHECGSLADDNKDHAIYASDVVDGLITDNVFWNIAAYAIQLYPHAQDTVFSHNVIDGGAPSVRGGVIVGSENSGTPSSGNIVEYNVIAYAAPYNITSYWGGTPGSGNIVQSNCLWKGRKGEIDRRSLTVKGNVVANPLFVNRARHDLGLGLHSACRSVVGAAAPGTRERG
jgi:hypothetical protein